MGLKNSDETCKKKETSKKTNSRNRTSTTETQKKSTKCEPGTISASIDSDSTSDESIWINLPELGLILSERDRQTLLNDNGWLSDAHVTGCFIWLYEQVLDKDLWQRPVYALHAKDLPLVTKRFVLQPLHLNGNHWACSIIEKSQTHKYKVAIYDSMSENQESYILPSETVKHFDRWLGKNNWTMEVVPTQQQNDGSSCGLFAIAFAFTLASGDNYMYGFDTRRFRTHLYKCLMDLKIELFPRK